MTDQDWDKKDSIWLSYQVRWCRSLKQINHLGPCGKEVKASRQMNTRQKQEAGKIIFVASFLWMSIEQYGISQDHRKEILDHSLTCVRGEHTGSNGNIRHSLKACLGFLKPRNQFCYYFENSEFLSHSSLLHTLQTFSARTAIWDQTCKYMNYKEVVLSVKLQCKLDDNSWWLKGREGNTGLREIQSHVIMLKLTILAELNQIIY